MSDHAAHGPEDVGSLTHALRTPLAVITGWAELLASGADDQPRDAAARILEAAERLSGLIDDLEERLEHGDVPPSVVERQLSEARARLSSAIRRDANVPCRVLVVDDDATLRHLLRMTLPAHGFQILEAPDATDALEQIGTHVPDLVILDWHLPDRSGSTVLDELQRRLPQLPVIVLTGEHRSTHRALAKALGARTFLTKPFSPLELLATVEALLAERPARDG